MFYASTSCLKNPRNLIKVLNEYQKLGIKNVELGSVHSYFEKNLLKKFDFNYIIHNYFPPPKIPFNFNLASQNKSIRKKSIQLAKNAIEFCRKIDSPIYTFHAGFTVDPSKLGSKFNYLKISNRSKSIITFIDSVIELVDLAKKNGIKLGMEPNVVQNFNIIDNQNKLLLFAELNEIEILFKFFKKNELGILLDLGHTSVTSHWLKFDKDQFVSKIKNNVIAIHISNNNGLRDQHKSLTKNCWQINVLKQFKNSPIILESMNLTPKEIFNNLKIIKSGL
jgi:sugar phosphate isomerase/epimerase